MALVDSEPKGRGRRSEGEERVEPKGGGREVDGR